MSYDLKNLPIISSGLTDSSIVFGAKDGQSDDDPDPINLSALWDYVLDKMESAQADAQTALGITALVESAAESAATASEAAEVASGAMTALLNPIFSTVATAEAYSPDAAPDYIRTAFYDGDFVIGSGATYRKVDTEPSHAGKFSITLSDGNTVVWYEIAEPVITPQMFGAKGDDSQTTAATSYQTDNATSPVTITEQTADGMAINAALRLLRARGGGHLHVPAGTYRVWGYLERVDFPLRLTGDGPGLSIIKNCDTSPTAANGYGIIIVQPSSLADITIENISFDGNAETRTKPTGEWRCYPLVFYGQVRAKLVNVNSVNSPIDCFYTGYGNNSDCSLQAVNCIFDNSYRNTVSLVSGWNQQYTNCKVIRGGKVHGGTNPRYGLDIEPDSASSTIRNITFSSCTFRDAVNVLAGGIWAGNVDFVACTFRVTEEGAEPGYPWMGYWRGGEFTFIGCSFEDRVGYQNRFVCENPVSTGEFVGSEFVKVKGCEFEGVGFDGFGRFMIVEGTEFRNALRPFSLKGSGSPQNAIVRGLRVINVVDPNNVNGGARASLCVLNTFEGYLEIDGAHVRIDPAALPAELDITSSTAYGIHTLPTLAADCEAKVTNVHVSGYYQKYPDLIGVSPSANNYRDWGNPSSAPADTEGQTAGPGSIFYRNCTMYGNNA